MITYPGCDGGKTIAVWDEGSDEEVGEPPILVCTYPGSRTIGIEQQGDNIILSPHVVKDLARALREAAKALESE